MIFSQHAIVRPPNLADADYKPYGFGWSAKKVCKRIPVRNRELCRHVVSILYTIRLIAFYPKPAKIQDSFPDKASFVVGQKIATALKDVMRLSFIKNEMNILGSTRFIRKRDLAPVLLTA